MKDILRHIIPAPVLSMYHLSLAWLGAVLTGFPSRRMLVIGVTGTKGKSSVTELVNAILEEAGHKTALINSIRLKVGANARENALRMSMPGRFFVHNFLAEALKEKCTAVVLEMTSEGARQHRHRFIDLDALIFTNLAPEHIESHGSYQAYADAKFSIAQALVRSHKRPRIVVANADDKESGRYLTLRVEYPLPFSLSSVDPHHADESGGYFTFEDERISLRLPGDFSLMNALAAATLTRALGIPTSTIGRALAKVDHIPGRAESVELGQKFKVIVDYAHTPESLRAIYSTYRTSRKICVLGSTGGGRDAWKRPVMGKIAQDHCDRVVLTDEDPYDEDPRQIVEDMAHGMSKRPEIVMDRREAIRRALEEAHEGDVVLITGKGTNHEICGPRGSKIAWSDRMVAEEELKKLIATRAV